MNNTSNTLITQHNLNEIIGTYSNNFISIQPRFLTTYQNAFRHKSVSIIDHNNDDEDNYSMFYLDNRIYSYERLEFLGDAVIKLVTAEYLYNRYPNEQEGFLTEIKSRLEKSSSLANFSKQLGFDKYLLLSCNIERMNGRTNDKILEDIYEGFIGALYKDQGFMICKQFIVSVYERYVNFEQLISSNDNHKNRLLIEFHRRVWGSPIYMTPLEVGTMNAKRFTSIVILNKQVVHDASKVNNESRKKIQDMSYKLYSNLQKLGSNMKEYALLDYYILSQGEGKTKKESEQIASKECMSIYT